MRVRANGKPLSADGVIDDAITLGQIGPYAVGYYELLKDLYELIRRERAQAYNDGLKDGENSVR